MHKHTILYISDTFRLNAGMVNPANNDQSFEMPLKTGIFRVLRCCSSVHGRMIGVKLLVADIIKKELNSIKKDIENNLLLFYTFMTRDAAKILESQIKATINKFDTLTQMKDLVEPLSLTLKRGNNTDDFGKILHQNWMLKKSLTSDNH